MVPVTRRTRSALILIVGSSGLRLGERVGSGDRVRRPLPSNQETRLATTHSPMARIVSSVALATCGVRTTLSSRRRSSGTTRLVVEDVEPSGTQAGRPRAPRPARLVDDPAAGDVDQDAPRSQRLDDRAGDDRRRWLLGPAGGADEEDVAVAGEGEGVGVGLVGGVAGTGSK